MDFNNIVSPPSVSGQISAVFVMHLFVLWPYCHLAVAPYFRHTSGLVCVLYLDSPSCFVGWGSSWKYVKFWNQPNLFFAGFWMLLVCFLLEAIICSSLLQSWTLENHMISKKKTTASIGAIKPKGGFESHGSWHWISYCCFDEPFIPPLPWILATCRRFGCHQGVLNRLSHPMADSQMYVVKRNGKKQDAAKFGGEKLRGLQLSNFWSSRVLFTRNLWFFLPGRFIGQETSGL